MWFGRTEFNLMWTVKNFHSSTSPVQSNYRMYNVTIITLLFTAIFQSVIIIVGNVFTIFVFWKNRNRLKRISFLLINLTVADLLVGFTEPIALETYLRRLKESSVNIDHNGEIFVTFQTSFSFASVFFLPLISVERAYALIWPLRHRAASINNYIYGANLAWVATIWTGHYIRWLNATC